MSVFSTRVLIPLFYFSCVLISGCRKDSALSHQKDASADPSAQQASAGGMTITEVPFTATALIAYCWGENVRISGTIENHVKTTSSASGNHYIRTWTVKGLTGVGVASNGTLTGTTYIVKGGAEMFSIKDALFNNDGSLNLNGSLAAGDLVIHRGEILLENTVTGEKVLARHDIQKIPGKGLMQNRWLCGGKQ